MSTLTVTNIKATSETNSREVSGVAAARLNYNHTTNTVKDSANQSSIIDTSSGLGTLNLTNAMSSSDFVFAAARNGTSTNTNIFITEVVSLAASSVNFSTKFADTSSITMGDANIYCISLFGDLA